MSSSRKYRNAQSLAWEARRSQLFGAAWKPSHKGGRAWVADQLGLSLATIERYETGEAPEWYDLALVGLWNRLHVDAGK